MVNQLINIRIVFNYWYEKKKKKKKKVIETMKYTFVRIDIKKMIILISRILFNNYI